MPFSTFLRPQGVHHCACAQKWCHFSFFSQELSNKKKINTLWPKMTKIVSRGSCLYHVGLQEKETHAFFQLPWVQIYYSTIFFCVVNKVNISISYVRYLLVHNKIASRRGAPQGSCDRHRHRSNFQTRPAQAFPKKVNISWGQGSVDAIKRFFNHYRSSPASIYMYKWEDRSTCLVSRIST